MWFKNLRVYRVSQCPDLTRADLQERLMADQLKPCGKIEPASSGWIPVYQRHDDRLVHSSDNGCHLMRYGLEERVLPPAVIREAMTEKLEQLEQESGRPAGRKLKLQIKDEIIMDLLPKAFVKPRSIDLWLDTRRGWLVVNSTSASQADEINSLLRQSIDGLRLVAPDIDNRIQTQATHWLQQGECDGKFSLSDECDLQSSDNQRAIVRCRAQDLYAPEIAAHLKSGKQVLKLGLSWADKLSFSLGIDFSLQRLGWLDLINQKLEAIDSEDFEEELAARFELMSQETGQLLDALAEVFEWSD